MLFLEILIRKAVSTPPSDNLVVIRISLQHTHVRVHIYTSAHASTNSVACVVYGLVVKTIEFTK